MFHKNVKCKDYIWEVLKTCSYENMDSFDFHFDYRR